MGRVMYSTWFTLIAENSAGSAEARAWVETRYPGGSSWRYARADTMNSARSPFPGPGTGTLRWTLELDHHQTDQLLIGHDCSVIVGGDRVARITPEGLLTWTFETALGHLVLAEDGTIYGVVLDQNYLWPKTNFPGPPIS